MPISNCLHHNSKVMRKLIHIFLFVCIGLTAAPAQTLPTVNVNLATASSTTIGWFTNYRPSIPWSVDVDYSNLNADNATFSLIVSGFGDGSYSYYSSCSNSFPFVLNKSAAAYTDTRGRSRATKLFFDIALPPFVQFGYKITKGSVTTGTLKIKLQQ